MLRNAFALNVLRPYIRRELPGWGKLYRSFVGDYRHNARWEGYSSRWMKGKSHGYEMLLDFKSWANRSTYFMGRHFDSFNPILISALLKEGDTFVDIGANEGMISLAAARQVGPTGRVIAFEPNPGPAGIFQKAIERNKIGQIDLRRYGLGEVDATLPLNIPAVNTGEGTFSLGHLKEDVTVVSCEVKNADAALDGIDAALIKIDVEGFEDHVIAGMPELLQRSRPPISIEISGECKAMNLLQAAGYRAYLPHYSGRGRNLRVELQPTDVRFFSVTTDVLMLHESDGLNETLPGLLKDVGPY